MSDSALAEYRKAAEAAAAVAHADPAVIAAQMTAAAVAETPSDGTGTTTATTTPATSLRRRSLLRARQQGAPLEATIHRAKPVVQKSRAEQTLNRMTEIRSDNGPGRCGMTFGIGEY